ncbi:cation efflux family-domain-containing protein [Pyronema domesticum]|uniref:Similar to Metal tolerance protein 3 acc. no. Q6Z7K5 n=1 Tax=Pyronema omphalodes (strain CBS 100304) TaxID=1076935 RepID=U4LUD7_PYROM|nr:cation efflux family-domain-containing protein [Pyronema domesticum]CCX33610.1 Similar to Metal tolerance protein 3; acc. no. Q6Z7K5 [Pyronema omphalodes CBS 100304]
MATITVTETSTHQDLELSPRSSVVDPLQLSSAIKSPAEIAQLTGGPQSRLPFSARRRSSSSDKKRDVKGLQNYYESQNAHIERMLKSVEDHRREAKDEQGDTRIRFLIAVHGSLAANILLATLQLYAAISSGSLSLFATAADSIFDPMANILLFVSHRAVNKVDSDRFPSGKARLETAGNIAFAFLMICVSWILIAMSARDLATAEHGATKDFNLASVIAVGVALCTKLVLFCYCWGLRNTYSQVMILWRDHRNDLPVNSFGLLTSIAGSKLAWWVDSMGAIMIGCAILVAWTRVVYSESLLLIGVAAPQELRNQITYVSMTHDERITHIDTVRAYHSGPRIIVEVDIVMKDDSTLRETHDVAESLQVKLESLPDVERAYVHVDYEVEHKPEHFLKKEL